MGVTLGRGVHPQWLPAEAAYSASSGANTDVTLTLEKATPHFRVSVDMATPHWPKWQLPYLGVWYHVEPKWLVLHLMHLLKIPHNPNNTENSTIQIPKCHLLYMMQTPRPQTPRPQTPGQFEGGRPMQRLPRADRLGGGAGHKLEQVVRESASLVWSRISYELELVGCVIVASPSMINTTDRFVRFTLYAQRLDISAVGFLNKVPEMSI